MAQLLSINPLKRYSAPKKPIIAKSVLQLVSPSMRLSLLASDVAAMLVAMVLATWVTGYIQQNILNVSTFVTMQTVMVRSNIYLALCFGVVAALWSKDMYSSRLPWWTQVQAIGKIILVAFIVDGFLSFAMQMPASRLLIGVSWLFACGLLVVMRYTLFKVVSRVDQWKVPTIIMADNDTTTDLLMAFHNDPCNGYNVHTAILRDTDWKNFDRKGLPHIYRKLKLRNGLKDCVSYVVENPSNFYVVSMDAFRGDARDDLIRTLNGVQAHYALVPSLTLSTVHGTTPHYYFGHDVMMVPAELLRLRHFSVGRITKRLMDIVISALALLLLSPVFIGVAVMLKIEGQGGSIFYGGHRVGRKGKLFKCWKFRSMEPDSDHLLNEYLEANPVMKARWDKYRKLPKDPRITTHTASVIRKLSIDELPQLWNVLVGDMSLVGPRPILKEETHYFGPRLRHYLSVRPGLTGLWQVSGRNQTSFMRRVYWDSWYVRNWSLWHDIIIMVKTPLVLLTRKGAY